MPLQDIPATELLASFPQPMLIMEPSGSLLYANPAATDLLGLTGDPVGRSILDFLPEQERSRLNPLAWMQRWAEVPDAPELQHVHLLVQTEDGRELPVRVRVGRLREGVDACYLVSFQDITAEQSRQQQTRQAHRLAARVLAISADAIINVDQNFNILYGNPSAEKLFGYASGELVGKPLDTLLPGRFRADHSAHMQRFSGERHAARLMGERSQVVGLTATGEEIPLEASITKVTLDQQLVYSAHLRDLRERNAQAAELARSLASFETVFEHALQAMALLDAQGRVQQINAAARRLLPEGLDVIGQQFSTLPFFSEDPAATSAQLEEAITACKEGKTFRVPATVVFPDGHSQALDFSLTPVLHQQKMFAMIAEARDLLETKEGAGA
ncbi:MAG: PAS domain S-box protein [Pseudomonadales bacterium]